VKNSNGKHIGSCQNCKNLFQATRSDAKFCSTTCREKYHRDTNIGRGKTWHSVRPEYAQKAQDIKNVSPSAYSDINALLEAFGGIAAEYAIAAAWNAAHDCVTVLERTK